MFNRGHRFGQGERARQATVHERLILDFGNRRRQGNRGERSAVLERIKFDDREACEVLQLVERSDCGVAFEHAAVACSRRIQSPHRSRLGIAQLTVAVGVPTRCGIHADGFHVFVFEADELRLDMDKVAPRRTYYEKIKLAEPENGWKSIYPRSYETRCRLLGIERIGKSGTVNWLKKKFWNTLIVKQHDLVKCFLKMG